MLNTPSGGWIIVVAVLGVDFLLPLGYAVPMLYVLPILLTGLLPSRQSTVLMVGGVSLLTWIGAAFSPGELTLEAFTNRAMATGLLLTIGGLLLIHKESAEKITAAQQARDQSEERLRLAQSAEGFGTVDWDIRGHNVTWSPETERIWGLPVGGFEGTYEHWRRLVHPDDVAEAERMAQLSLDNPDIPYACDHRIVRPDGTVRWIHAKATTVRDAAGRPIRMVGVNTDITERKRIEEALRESEERFAKAFRMSPHPIGITEVATGCCIEVNDACLQLFGFRREEVIGHTTLMLGIWQNPEDRARLIEQLKAREPVRNLEVTVRTKSGDLRHILVSSDQVELSGTLCLITVGNDITARKRAEETLRQLNETLEQRVVDRTMALREAEERFRGIFEHAAEGIAITDLEGRFVQCNAAYVAMVGYTEHELRGLQFESLVYPDDRLHNMAFVRRLVSGAVPSFEVESRYLMKSGSTVWVHKHASILRNDQGVPTHLMVLVTDISARKQSELLLQSNEAFTRDVLDSLSAYVCVLDRDGIILQTNEPWRRFARANSDTNVGIGAVGDNYLDICRRAIAGGDTTVRPILSGIESVLAGSQEMFSAEHPCQSSENKRWFLIRVSPLRDSQGVVLSHLDITYRKIIEETLLRKQQELERSQAQLEGLTAKLLMAQETEGRRLARELHDDITQRIATVAIDLQSIGPPTPGYETSLVAHVHQAGKMAEEITTDLQRLAHQLHPSLLEHAGLEAAVQEHVEEFQARAGLKTKVRVRNLPPAMSLDCATCLYRVLQESLQNVRKHANATHVLVRLVGSRRGIGLCIHDDGCGFDLVRKASNGRQGLGLVSMEERVGMLKGRFLVRTKVGDGTRVHVWVPLDQHEGTTNGGAGP